ncbi:MAG: intradiol ring-cleavage dioxygenase [Citromicrobium sp.]|nr:MAG: intradiol ring-cleavage dioxygenase [Citromicrobium sp.]
MSQFTRDFRHLIGRRHALGLIGTTATGLALAGCSQADSGPGGGGPGGPPPGGGRGMQGYPDVVGTAADGSTCVAFPGETEGPYPADGRGRRAVANVLEQDTLNRSDIRSSFGGMTGTAQGVPLSLELQLVDVDHGCRPLAGHALYIWQCDAAGEYSLYTLEDQNYLRGLQVADSGGVVRFRSIFPACYTGRFPHIHFELFENLASATGGSNALLTSQLALPETADNAVYRDTSAYPGSAGNLSRVSLSNDNVFGDNTDAQVRAQTLAMRGSPAAGYSASAIIGYTATYA